ncbi:amino acid adenylation domain-containing protein, partial [Flavitalea flava]
IIDLFIEQVRRTPDAAAVIFGEESLSYRELDERSNRLGHYLRGKGVKEETLIGICMDRSPNLVISILGILKAGGAYVPIDPVYPASRIRYILEDTGISIIVCSQDLAPLFSDRILVCMDSNWEKIAGEPGTTPVTALNEDNLAYVIYTSGSTGQPKGVMIEHRSLVNYLLNSKTQYSGKWDAGDGNGTYIHMSYTFDASVTGLFLPLLSGLSLVIGKVKGAGVFGDKNMGINSPYSFIKLTPAHMPLLEDALREGTGQPLTRRLILGGEALRVSHFQYWRDQNINVEIINEYGPTEATVGCCIYSFNTGDIITEGSNGVSIGKPIDNVQIYLLDAGRELVPIGVTGELYIGGAGLARGYWNRPDLTKEKFITDPFSSIPGARLYKTGDLARWLPDGNLDYLGRADEQVKIRGYRVEPGEVEMVLQQCDAVQQGVVVARKGSDGMLRLIAFVVPEGPFDREGIMNFLTERLPEYMVPSLLAVLEEMPLTLNGKIDRKALPDLETDLSLARRYVAPRNELEVQLSAIWQELMELEQIGINDDFFELGVHSLLAIRLIAMIRKRLGIEVPIGDIFDYPTIALLSAKLVGLHQGDIVQTRLIPQNRPASIPLSFSQERLWFIDRLEGSVAYHIPTILRLRGPLNEKALEFAFRQIINRHEILRTVIEEDQGRASQRVLEKDRWNLDIIGNGVFTEEGNAFQTSMAKLISRPFDLSEDHKLRAHLIRTGKEGSMTGNEETILVVILHHIASDGWSNGIMISEFIALYNAYAKGKMVSLKPLPIQYADYAIWQRNYLSGDVLENRLAYWQEKLEGIIPLDIPANYTRPSIQSTRGETFRFGINGELAAGLQALSRSQGATLFMTLLSAFQVLLFRYSGQEDITIGSPVAGRQQSETEGLIGFFVNILALRVDLSGNPSFKLVLERVKRITLEAYEHQDIPFEKVVEAVIKERDMSRSPLFQVVFTLQNNDLRPLEETGFGGLELIPEIPTHTTSKFDLTFLLTKSPAGLEGIVEYCTDLYREDTIRQLAGHYTGLLSAIVRAPDQTIGELAMLTQDERDQLQTGFNQTRMDYPPDRTIIDLFHDQVARTPDSIAVIFENEILNYRELNERSTQLAGHLRGAGMRKGGLVGLCLERSLEMILGILGVMKAGGAYVPIDPEYPADRINYILEDTGTEIVLTTRSCRERIPAVLAGTAGENKTGRLLIELDSDWAEIPGETNSRIITPLTPDDLAYVIYTSGSTGKPKGVMIDHNGLYNRLLWAQGYYKLKSADAVLQKTTYCFDVSVWELLWPLLTGSRLVFAKPGGHKDVDYLKGIIDTQKITTLHFVPPMLELFLLEIRPGDCKSIRQVLCSGEALKISQVNLFRERLPHAGLHNLYGPTEASIDVTYWSWSEEEKIITSVPIGRPVANTAIYILDKGKQIVPLGGIGELYIGGVQLAKGYLNQPELTFDRFIQDPFNREAEAKLYRTGDLGRWLPDGNIEYLGRIDDQVKIRGYRVELGEIEHCLSSIDGVVNAKAVAVEDEKKGSKKIQAYLQIDKDSLPLLSSYQHLFNHQQILKQDLHVLPNGLPVLGPNGNEIEFLYREIFEDHCYLKHGITLDENSCVVDVGANIGLFSIFLNALHRNIKVYSFEPVPEIYAYLVKNRSLYGIKGKSFPLALLDKEQEIEFTFYPQMSILSGISADKTEVRDVVRSYVSYTGNKDLQAEEMDSLLDLKLESRLVNCQAKTLSQIIQEEKMDKIDLLKVDVENSEDLVLDGILDRDWAKIESLVLEVHDTDGRLSRVTDKLRQRGFRVFVEKEKYLAGDNLLFNLFAVQNDRTGKKSLSVDNLSLRSKGWVNPKDFVKTIRDKLQTQLPDYMIPAQLILVDQFPLTANGKIDNKALPDPDMDISLSVGQYMAPRNELELLLAHTWQELLGIERIGINDNFFGMGGDSIITIQVVSRIRRHGYALQPRDIFTNQDISSLSTSILSRTGAAGALPAEQGILTGECGLLPIQQGYLARIQEGEASRFNQSVLLGINKGVEEKVVQQAVYELLKFHDALRFRYYREEKGWRQEYGNQIENIHRIFFVEEMQLFKPEELDKALEDLANNYQKSLSLEQGDLVRVVLFRTGGTETYNRLLIVIHHLAVDGVSWRILLEDMEGLLGSGGQAISGQKGNSYRQWYGSLEEYGRSRRLLSQENYWTQITDQYKPFHLEKNPSGLIRLRDTANYSERLNARLTQRLVQDTGAAYHTEINDILLCALGLTIRDWSGNDQVVVGLEGHGREDIGLALDTSRTVGWFTNLYPVAINTEAVQDPGVHIRSVKEQLRKVPDKGIGYGVLKYILGLEKLQGREPWDIVFNYLGQLDNVIGKGNWLVLSGGSGGATISEESEVREKLAVNCRIAGGELVVSWSYSKLHFTEPEIQILAGRYINHLMSLITHCVEQKGEGPVYTPSDYGLGKEVSYGELDSFIKDRDSEMKNIMEF